MLKRLSVTAVGLLVIAGAVALGHHVWTVREKSMDLYHSTLKVGQRKVCDDTDCWYEDVFRVQITRR